MAHPPADILLGNREEFENILGEEPSETFQPASRLFVITDGAKGALIVGRDQCIEIPAKSLSTIIDATGAGDQFAAGFLFGYIRNLPLKHCGELGIDTATAIMGTKGGRPTSDWQRIAKSYLTISTTETAFSLLHMKP